MSRLVINRDGGKADEYGFLLGLSRLLKLGVIEGFTVAENASPNMTVVVAPGSGHIGTGAAPAHYGYFVAHDTSAGEVVPVSAANAGNPRIDIVAMYVDKGVTPTQVDPNNPNNMLKFKSVSGIPASTASDPTDSAIQASVGAGNPWLKLWRVFVPAGATQIGPSQILQDLRTLVTLRNPAVVTKVHTERSSPVSPVHGSSDPEVAYNGFLTTDIFRVQKDHTYEIALHEPIVSVSTGTPANLLLHFYLGGTKVGSSFKAFYSNGVGDTADHVVRWKATETAEVALTVNFSTSGGVGGTWTMSASATNKATLDVTEMP